MLIYFCLIYLQCLQGEVAELVDATRELGTLLFTGLEIQWLPLYRFESDLLHEKVMFKEDFEFDLGYK